MRTTTFTTLTTFLAAATFAVASALTGCSVSVVGAACDNDTNCLTGQHCVAHVCSAAPSSASTSTTASSSTGSSTGSPSSSSGSTGTGSSSGSASGSSGTSGSQCEAGPALGQACPTLLATECDPSSPRVLYCAATDAGCNQWNIDLLGICHLVDLVCVDDGGSARCDCGDHPTGQIWVDAVVSVDAGYVTPTGAQTPEYCRFPTLTAALAVAQSGDTVEATLPDPWHSSHMVDTGTLTRPANSGRAAGHYFAALHAGLTGSTEPIWVLDGGVTGDGSTAWTEAGSTIFSNESFGLEVPSGVTVETSDCPLQEPFSKYCPPTDFIIEVPPGANDPAIQLDNASALVGFGILDLRSYGSTLYCDGSAKITLQSLELVSPTDAGAGLTAGAGCSVEAEGLAIAGFQAGVQLNSSGISTLDGVSLGLAAGQATGFPAGNGTGLAVTNGQVEFLESEVLSDYTGIDLEGGSLVVYDTIISGSTNLGVRVHGGALTFIDGGIGGSMGLSATSIIGGDGVRVESTPLTSLVDGGTAPTAATFVNTSIAGNAGYGVDVEPTHEDIAVVALASSTVTGNGASGIEFGTGTPPNASGGILVGVDVSGNGTRHIVGNQEGVRIISPTNLEVVSSAFHDNPGAQLAFNAPAPDGGAYDLSSPSCATSGGSNNAVYCYPTPSIGISATNGASVDATNLFWASVGPSSEAGDYSGNVIIGLGGVCIPAITTCP